MTLNAKLNDAFAPLDVLFSDVDFPYTHFLCQPRIGFTTVLDYTGLPENIEGGVSSFFPLAQLCVSQSS